MKNEKKGVEIQIMMGNNKKFLAYKLFVSMIY